MTIDFTSQDALFGKNFTVYQNQMTETEKLKEQIKLLQSKLSSLGELEKTKSPAEEAYKRVYGNYPVTDIADTCWSGSTWTNFATGYNAAQKDYKVGSWYQEPEPKEEHKTLYDILRELDKPMFIDDVCSAVKRWIFQYDCDYGVGKGYLEGYQGCQTVLEEGLQ